MRSSFWTTLILAIAFIGAAADRGQAQECDADCNEPETMCSLNACYDGRLKRTCRAYNQCSPPNVSLTAPTNGATVTAGSNILLTATASDVGGLIAKVEFFANGALRGTDTTNPYAITWSNVAAGSYSLTARATDNQYQTTTSTAVNIVVNALPSVSLTSPVNGATFTAGSNISLTATASDPGGSITKVEFFANGALRGTDTTSPYGITWSNVAAGSYSLTARATDNNGATRTSTAVNIVVSNPPPSVSLTSPANGATFTMPATVTLTASASDANGSVTLVEFFAGTSLIGSDTAAPYSIAWSPSAAGSHSLTARATDNGGATKTSTAVNIVVSANPPPSVSLTSPANGATFTMPATVTLTASASDTNGSVARVEFFAETSLIGSDTTAPYSVSWSPSAAGTYVLTARATDNAGAVTTSGGVSVTVALPTFTILVNGSRTDPYTSWTQPGTDEFNAIAATYGVSPQPWPWTSNSLGEVIPPSYGGIVQGGQDLANFLNSLPPGDVNIISHSHGGNVVLTSQAWSSRPIRRYIQLATPVNWDFGDWRLALGYGVAGRCQVSSTADWVQFAGASPTQISNFVYFTYQSVAGAIEAFDALNAGDYESAYAYFAWSVFDAIEAEYWWETTKKEVEGPTAWFTGLGHTQMHEPPVWNEIVNRGCFY